MFMNARDNDEPARSDGSMASASPRHAGVLGAGQMGAGIAWALVQAGLTTAMVDTSAAMLDGGRNRIADLTAGKGGGAGLPAEQVEQVLSRLQTSTSLEILSDCDLIIEAITEDESAKTGVFRQLESIVPASTILASNTSTIPISRMALALAHRGRFAGMHFFHPVHRMQLVEVIQGEETSDHTVAVLADLARRIGKTPIVVRDCPGFLVTRVMYPYLTQALRLLREGTSMDAIDEAATTFGMPMGPIAVMDLVGLDTVFAITKVMAEGYPDRAEPSPLLAAMVQAGRLGRKSGAGFRSHPAKGARPVEDPSVRDLLALHRLEGAAQSQQSIVDRLFLPMLIEAIRVLDEKIVRDPADIDAGVRLGLGFPASRGGILAWCDALGPGAIMDRLPMYQSLGPAFQPPATLARMAQSGTRFHTA
jgi:3-hydroxyacyl-CoA dehydrogenase/enoyl-CoA hydratase/3-hydroxybutyryl-CoA epimerase/3-hydroxyacyl-CoA dehydrogenase/enoyl-CoA hydratase/3-hydroxybutyryl-CoA epimerase/enoyl-CoA isomerase